jgi:hypothetical protein
MAPNEYASAAQSHGSVPAGGGKAGGIRSDGGNTALNDCVNGIYNTSGSSGRDNGLHNNNGTEALMNSITHTMNSQHMRPDDSVGTKQSINDLSVEQANEHQQHGAPLGPRGSAGSCELQLPPVQQLAHRPTRSRSAMQLM